MKINSITNATILTKWFKDNPGIARKSLKDEDLRYYDHGFSSGTIINGDHWVSIALCIGRYNILEPGVAEIHFYRPDRYRSNSYLKHCYNEFEKYLKEKGFNKLVVIYPVTCKHVGIAMRFANFTLDYERSFNKTFWRGCWQPSMYYIKEI